MSTSGPPAGVGFATEQSGGGLQGQRGAVRARLCGGPRTRRRRRAAGQRPGGLRSGSRAGSRRRPGARGGRRERGERGEGGTAFQRPAGPVSVQPDTFPVRHAQRAGAVPDRVRAHTPGRDPAGAQPHEAARGRPRPDPRAHPPGRPTRATCAEWPSRNRPLRSTTIASARHSRSISPMPTVSTGWVPRRRPRRAGREPPTARRRRWHRR